MRAVPDPLPKNDPTWEPDVLILAIELVKEGLHGVIIKQFLGVTKSKISRIHQWVHGTALLAGRPVQGDARFFLNARNSKDRSGAEWNLHGTLFLHAYQALLDATAGRKLNRGWLLLNAFRAYRRWSQPLAERGTARLTINQAYSLLRLSALYNVGEYGEIALAHCKDCNRSYLISLKHEKSTQRCPLHAIEAEHRRLVEQARTALPKVKLAANGS